MIVFLHGKDDYRRAKEKRAIIEKFLKKHSSLGVRHFDFALPKSRLDGTEASSTIESLKEFSRNTGLFDSQRLAVVDSAWEAPEKELKEWLGSVKDSKTVTALLSESEAPKKEFAFLKTPPVLSEEFNLLEGAAWIKFIDREAKARGVMLAPEAAKFLSEVYEGASWRLITELDRFAGEKRAIGRQELEAWGVEIRPEFFALARRFGYGDRNARLAALEALFLSRDPAAKIFNILSAMTPGATARFAAYDRAVKSGKLEYEEALTDLALS